VIWKVQLTDLTNAAKDEFINNTAAVEREPNSPITIDIYDGSTLLPRVLADQPRDNLSNAGIGNGRHGFSYAIAAGRKMPRPIESGRSVQGLTKS
jgi:hypothetical protein